MNRVTTVARRKIAFVIILFGMMALVLSPWSDSPRREAAPAVTVPEQQAEPSTELPVALKEPASLSVAVAMDEAAFKELASQNIRFRSRHPDITVTLTRVGPEEAYRYFARASAMDESADIMLLKNEWVNEFAASGYLLPADNAFTGKTLAEQFDAISSAVKWNDHMWGVPLDIDPYVLVWNTTLLREWLGEGVTLPLEIEQWSEAAARSEAGDAAPTEGDSQELVDPQLGEESGPVAWLSLDPREPHALLAWLENVTGERTDELWNGAGESWDETALGAALRLLDSHRPGVQFSQREETEAKLLSGETLVAALPYSSAARLLERSEAEAALELDHSSWKLPYVWTRGTSYVISANTVAKEAAFTWITEMTTADVQSNNEQVLRRLPVYRSLYDGNTVLSNLLPSRTGQSFPNQASAAAGPRLPARLQQLSSLWESYAMEQRTLEEWKLGWNESLAKLQDDD